MFTSFIKKPRNLKFGFTLIELLVVIAIIGVLASIVLASLNAARKKSRDARRISDVKQIQLGLELYFDGPGSGQYPVATTGGSNCSATIQYGLEVMVPNYMPQIARDPNAAAPNCYLYATPSAVSRSTYHLGATIEETSAAVLSNDKDCVSSGTATCVSGITAYTGGFDGTSAQVYDLIP